MPSVSNHYIKATSIIPLKIRKKKKLTSGIGAGEEWQPHVKGKEMAECGAGGCSGFCLTAVKRK